MALRCLIVDDNPSVLHAARTLLEREGVDVLGAVSNIGDALQLAGQLRPDVTLVDIDLAGQSGFELVQRLAPARAILISAYSEGDFADLIEASPALGFLAKSQLSAGAIETILNAHPGT
jgi:DNA-binding NarL/FixJ family response regulator